MDNLISVEEALRLMEAAARPLPKTSAPLSEAVGRVLAKEIKARLTHPPFAVSAMDGFALHAEDARTIPARLNLIGESAAGKPYQGEVSRGEAVKIQTGASIPSPLDAIAPKEITKTEGEHVKILKPVLIKRFIREAGQDFSRREVLLPKGHLLDAAAIGLAAAGGHDALIVPRKPRVSVLASGSELVAAGVSPKRGQIVSSNSYVLTALLNQMNAEVEDLGIASDSLADLESALAKSAAPDLLITIGGVSVGEHDLILPALRKRGFETILHGVAMRPGKPFLFGRLGKAFVMGLPGNPVSALVCAHLFIRPFLRALGGHDAPYQDKSESAILDKSIPANGARQSYLRGRLRKDGDALHVLPFARQDSALLRDMAYADALISRPPSSPSAEAGDETRILRLAF